ncbi:MAG: MFS transporter [Candidatus Aphodosoma sp.]
MLKIQEKRNNAFFAMLSLPATAMGFALSVQISALSWILSTKYGLDIHEIGIVWAAGPIAGIIAQPIVGAISDKLWFMGGRRRPWIIIGGILTGLMLLALPNLDIVQKILMGDNATEGLLAIAVAVALTLDLSINVSFNPTRSLVADCTTKDERSKGYTWMQTVSGTFGVLAYLIAVIFNNEVLIYVGIFIALFFTIIPSLLIVEPRELEKENEEIVAGSDKKSNSIKEMILSLVPLSGFLIYGIYVIIAKLFGFEDTSSLTFFGSITLSSVEFICIIIEILAIIAVLLNITKQSKNNNEFQKILMAHSFTWWGVQTMNIYMFFYISTKITGLSAEAMASTNSWAFLVRDLVGAILPVLVLNVIAKKSGMTRTHTFSILLMALGYAIIALFGSNIIVFFAALLLVGIGWASLVSLPFAIMSEKVDQSKMGLYMGIFNLSVVLPQLVASFKMGEVINNAQDKSIIFVICAVCLAISGILWFSVKNDKVK